MEEWPMPRYTVVVVMTLNLSFDVTQQLAFADFADVALVWLANGKRIKRITLNFYSINSFGVLLLLDQIGGSL